MFDTLRNLIGGLAGGEATPQFDDNDCRLAAAALLVHAAGIDGNVSDLESARLRQRLKARFELDDAQASALIAQASDAEREAVDLYRFTSLLDRKLDEADKLRIVEMMWDIVYADGHVGEFEDNLLWRVADLLHVSRHERIALRLQAAQRSGGEPG